MREELAARAAGTSNNGAEPAAARVSTPHRIGFRSALSRLRLSGSGGSAIVEFAVSIPLFLMLILATFQFAIIMFNYESASFAIHQAARFASTHSSTSLSPCTATQVAAVAQTYLWSPSGSSTVSVSWPNGNTVGNTVQVSVTESYSVVLFNSTVSAVNITNSVQYAIMR